MAKANLHLESFRVMKTIISKIYFTRGQKVMLDIDLAALYQVENKQLKGN